MPSVKTAMASAKVRISELRAVQGWIKLKKRSKVAYYVVMGSFIVYSVAEILQSFVGLEISDKLSKALKKVLPGYDWPDTPDELAAALELFMAEATPAELQKLAACLQEEGLDLTLEDGVDVTELLDDDSPVSKMIDPSVKSPYSGEYKEVMIGLDEAISAAEASESPAFKVRLQFLRRIKSLALRHGVSVSELQELKEVLAVSDATDFAEAELVH
jgi:hypothetical protein